MNGVWSLYLHPNASLAVFFFFFFLFLSISITQTSFHKLGRNPKAETRPPPVSKCNAFKPISCALSHCFWAARVATRCFHAVLVLSLPLRWLLNHIPTISSLGHCYHLCDLHYVRASKRTHTHKKQADPGTHVDGQSWIGRGREQESILGLNVLRRSEPYSFFFHLIVCT